MQFTERQEFYSFAVDEKDVLEIDSDGATFLSKQILKHAEILRSDAATYPKDHKILAANDAVDSAAHFLEPLYAYQKQAVLHGNLIDNKDKTNRRVQYELYESGKFGKSGDFGQEPIATGPTAGYAVNHRESYAQLCDFFRPPHSSLFHAHLALDNSEGSSSSRGTERDATIVKDSMWTLFYVDVHIDINFEDDSSIGIVLILSQSGRSAAW